MKENNDKKNKFKILKIILLIIILLFFVNVLLIACCKYNMNADNITKEQFGGVIVSIAESKFPGEYDIQAQIISDGIYKGQQKNGTLMSYKEYVNYCENNNLHQKYTNIFCDYVVVTSNVYKGQKIRPELAAVSSDGVFLNSVILYTYVENVQEEQTENQKYTIIIPVSKFIRLVRIKENVFSREEYEKMKENKYLDLTCAS